MEWAENYHIANDLKQVDTRVGKYARRAIQLSPYLKQRFRTRGYQILHKSNGSILESIPVDPEGEAGSNADFIQFCFDDQTEILTRDGWKGWETLSHEDEIATRSKKGEFEWQKPIDIHVNDYQGKMIGVDQLGMKMLVTPEHRVFGKFMGVVAPSPDLQIRGIKFGKYIDSLKNRLMKAEKAKKARYFYPELKSEWIGGQLSTLQIPATYHKAWGKKLSVLQEEREVSPVLYAEFMGWYLSEGSLIRKHGEIQGLSCQVVYYR